MTVPPPSFAVKSSVRKKKSKMKACGNRMLTFIRSPKLKNSYMLFFKAWLNCGSCSLYGVGCTKPVVPDQIDQCVDTAEQTCVQSMHYRLQRLYVARNRQSCSLINNWPHGTEL